MRRHASWSLYQGTLMLVVLRSLGKPEESSTHFQRVNTLGLIQRVFYLELLQENT